MQSDQTTTHPRATVQEPGVEERNALQASTELGGKGQPPPHGPAHRACWKRQVPVLGGGQRGASACARALPTSTCHRISLRPQRRRKQLKEWASGQRPVRRRAEAHPGGCLPLGRQDVPWLWCVRRPFMWEVPLPETQTPGPS